MCFNRCPVCLCKDNGPFVGIKGFAFLPLDNGTQLYGFGAVNRDGNCCCSIGGGFPTLEAANAAAKDADKDREAIENDNRDAMAMYADDNDYGPADSDPYDCDRYGY